MKIKKTSWRYKLIDFVFCAESKTTCWFYLELLVAIIACPFLFYMDYVGYKFDISEKEENPKPGQTRLGVKDKWNELGWMFIIFIVMWGCSLAFTLIIGCFITGFNTKVDIPKELGGWPVVHMMVAAGMFVYPFILFWIRKVYKRLKINLCKPITYID